MTARKSEPVQTPAPVALHRVRMPEGGDWDEWRRSVEDRFDVGDEQFTLLRAEMKFNTDVTSEIRDIVIAFAAFARFCKHAGRGVAWCGKWLFRIVKVGGAIAASIAAIWGLLWAFRHGAPPPGVEEALPGHEQPQGRPPERPGTSRR